MTINLTVILDKPDIGKHEEVVKALLERGLPLLLINSYIYRVGLENLFNGIKSKREDKGAEDKIIKLLKNPPSSKTDKEPA